MMKQKSIINYAGLGSKELNSMLMNNNKNISPEIIDKELELNKELEIIKQGKERIVYAHDFITGIDKSTLKKWYKKNLGKVIMFPNFLSASLREWTTEVTKYKITRLKNSSGKNIFDIVNKHSEMEVLFMSKSLFKIIDVDDHIILQEVNHIIPDYVLYKNLFHKEGLINYTKSTESIKSLSDQGLI